MAFVGRAQEKAKLLRFFNDALSMAALIYGRRRVGKSELIKQSLKESQLEYLYYECKQTTEMNNVDGLSVLIAEAFNLPSVGFKNLEAVLQFLFHKGTEFPFVLVLDEYSYLRETVKGLDSILQGLIDKYRDNTSLKLIICGSFVETMRSLLLVQNPLYGRVDLTINLKPMNYIESALFYPRFSNEDKVRLYSVFGGIPYYNRLIDENKTVRDNIIDLIASPGARLETEIGMNLKTELSKMVNANAVFEALARGFCRYKDIMDQAHISSGPTLIDVLDRLMRMEVVAKAAPINDEHNKKKSGYYICDNLSLFYYKYIFRYLSQMSVMQPTVFFERYIQHDFDTDHVPHIFEEMCRQYLIELNRNGLIKEPFDKIGRYYYDDPVNKTNGEFDIVTQDSKGYVFYEAKFRKQPVDKKLVETEILQVQSAGLNCYKYGFFSRSGFAQDVREMNDITLIELDDMYSL